MNDITLYSEPAFTTWRLAGMWIQWACYYAALWMLTVVPAASLLKERIKKNA